ncbi:MAG: hypothetical protein H7069_12025 [Phormidesmis sp. FL-bin-119]|nr:hypothetical protein [Pedobacter sp.]
MYRIKTFRSMLLFFFTLICIVSGMSFRTVSFSSYPGNISSADTTIKTIPYSAETVRPLKILFDYYHHTRPNTKVGNHMITGSWVAGAGRYGWDDFVHTNTFDPVFTALEKEFYISIGGESFTKSLLSENDAVLIINPDNPKVVPEVPVITDTEISNLLSFVKQGGSLMIMINSGGSERASEDFESVQLRKLVQSFGLDWNNDDTHYSDVVIGDSHPYFYDVPVFHYGSGCTIQIMPSAERPEVLMEVASDKGYPDRHVKGPGIVMVRPGKGKVILVGDAGSWTGNISRPWADNEMILKQMFRYLKPDNKVAVPQYPTGKKWKYDVTIAGLQAIPVANSLSEIPKTEYKLFYPRERTGMPYLEGTASLTLTNTGRTKDNASSLEAKITNFKWFDKPLADTNQLARFTVSRQGKVTGVEAKGKAASWLAPDMPSLVALLPVDGIRPGDRWEINEAVRVPVLQGTELAPLRPVVTEVIYVRDTDISGRKCRLLRSSGEIWLKDLNIKVEDLLPPEEVNRMGGSHYRFLTDRGGKLLFKREQWVDHSTGIVAKARTQTRIVAWVHDLRKAVNVSNADKDNNMVVSLAQTVTLVLK